jgi:hypothetical protein
MDIAINGGASIKVGNDVIGGAGTSGSFGVGEKYQRRSSGRTRNASTQVSRN